MKVKLKNIIAIILIFLLIITSFAPILYAKDEIAIQVQDEEKQEEQITKQDEEEILIDKESENSKTLENIKDNEKDKDLLQDNETRNVPGDETDTLSTKSVDVNASLSEGIYEIASAKSENYLLNIASNSNLQIYSKTSGKKQKFYIEYIKEENCYQIKAIETGKVLDVQDGGKVNGTNVQLYESNNTDAQKWTISEKDGKYSIISKANGLYLDIRDGRIANSSNLQVYEGNDTDAQKFVLRKIQTVDEGIYEINSSKDRNKLITTSENSNVQINNKANSKTQKFKITNLEDNFSTIQVLDTEKVLDVEGGKTANRTNVQVYTSNNTDAQKWLILDEGNGQYSIMSKSSGRYIDIKDGNVFDGNNIQIYDGNGSSAQNFLLNKISVIEGSKSISNGEYYIEIAKDQNKVLEIYNNNVQINGKNHSERQKFKIEYVKDGYYKIIASNNKVFDVENGYTYNSTNVQTYDNNNTSAQKWIIKEETNNQYSIISWKSELYLDVKGGRTDNGTNVQIYENNGSSAQRFIFKNANEEIKVDDGIYKIKTCIDNNMVLDISEVSTENSANVQIWKDEEVKNQKFYLKYENGYYTIRAMHSKKSLDVQNASTKPGANVQQYEFNNTDAQKWILKDAGDGYLYIVSKCNNLYLDVQDGKTFNGANIQMYTGNATDAQKFKLEKTDVQAIEDGMYEIQIQKDKSKVLDISGGSTKDRANLQIWTRDNVNQQKFICIYDSVNKNYEIKAVHSGKVLDVDGGGTTNCTNVQQYTQNGTNAQKWKIKDLGDGTFNIISECSGLYLDVNDAKTENGTNVHTYQSNGSIAQLFIFVPTTEAKQNYSDFESVNESKYPGYKQLLEQLQAKHPNWTIKLKYTGLDWNTVISRESSTDGNGTPYSLTDYTGNWRNSSDTRHYGAGFYRASNEAIAYMMDPRNSLDQYYVFQFQELASSSGTYNQIKKMISGTYLEKYNVVDVILQASRDYSVSPFHLVSRMIQEQGSGGWCSNGYSYNGRTVYNFCNIGATGSSDLEIITNGAQYAYDNHWFTPEMCINGSAKFLHDKYFSKGQSTLYFQKYNVVTSSPYTNQYMQNIRAANDEGYRIAKSYENNGLLNSSFTFTIPVYENMPQQACPRPTT